MAFFKPNVISASLMTLGGSFAKVGFNFGTDGQISSYVENYRFEGNTKLIAYFALHGIFIGITILLNTIGLRFYAKSMAVNGAANATVYNFWFAYIASLIWGALFF